MATGEVLSRDESGEFLTLTAPDFSGIHIRARPGHLGPDPKGAVYPAEASVSQVTEQQDHR